MAAPDLPELQPTELVRQSGELVLDGALVEPGAPPVAVQRLELLESELRGVRFESSGPLELRLRDVILRDCYLSNLVARAGTLTRVQIRDSRLLGVGLATATVRDVTISDCQLSLGSFAAAELRDVVFERVNLREASFSAARLQDVSFVDCQIEGADFRRAVSRNCVMRGSSLDGVLGIDALRGLTMGWNDVLASAGALAAAAGIEIES